MSDENQDRQLAGLQKVLQISRSLVATTDIDSLLALIIERSMELLAAERASLFLYDTSSNELLTRVAAGVDEIRVPADKGIAGATVKSGSTIIVPDVYADDRWNPDVDRRTGFKTRNILSVPLKDYEGGLVGVLQVINKRRGGFDDYDVTLAETLAAQAGVAIQRATLIDHYLIKQEMERAMKIAQDIQRGLLPQSNPQISGFDVAGFCRPADETGGDTYDFMQLPGGRWMMMIADATGHGIGAALVIAETRAMLRAIGLGGADASAVLGSANDLLTGDLTEGRFVTCFLGVLDPAAASLSYASAGHGPILFYDRNCDAFRQAPATSLPLGVMAQVDYSQLETVPMKSGDLAVIITDGIFEAINADDEQFGIDRIIQLLRRDRDLPAAQITDSLRDAVLDFTKGQPQADDLTAVVIRKS